MRPDTLALLVLVTACGGKGAAKPAVARTPGARLCAVEIARADTTPWQEVTGDGFVFCVPATWRGNGHRWGGQGSFVSWGLGRDRRTTINQPLLRVPATAGAVAAPMPGVQHRFTEMIGGEEATIWVVRYGDTTHSGVEWPSRGMHMFGDAPGPEAAGMEIDIYRTVRFTRRTR